MLWWPASLSVCAWDGPWPSAQTVASECRCRGASWSEPLPGRFAWSVARRGGFSWQVPLAFTSRCDSFVGVSGRGRRSRRRRERRGRGGQGGQGLSCRGANFGAFSGEYFG